MYIDLRRIDLEYLVNFLDEPLNKCVGTQSMVSHALKKKKKKIFVGLWSMEWAVWFRCLNYIIIENDRKINNDIRLIMMWTIGYELLG